MSGKVIKFPETKDHRWARWCRIQIGLINGHQPESQEDCSFFKAYPETYEFGWMHYRAVARGQTDHIGPDERDEYL